MVMPDMIRSIFPLFSAGRRSAKGMPAILSFTPMAEAMSVAMSGSSPMIFPSLVVALRGG